MIHRMREARNVPAVNKTRLATMRAEGVTGIIFVCEGVDDKRVYFHWLKTLQICKGFEFLVCSGKRKVLELRALLSRDLSGLSSGVYYLVDRDFDDLCGYVSGSDLYMTDCYSIENELVCNEVLDRVLSIDLHCDSPVARSSVVSMFEKVYKKFLLITKSHNERVFLARRLEIPTKPLPDKASKISIVELEDVRYNLMPVCHVIQLDREPDASEFGSVLNEFGELDAQKRYRGKFAFSFFLAWLELLASDRVSSSSKLFSGCPRSAANVVKQFNLESIASKAPVPASFGSFVQAIA